MTDHQQHLELELEKLFREHYGKLVTSLISYFGLKEIATAEDIVQETFLAAAESWERVLPDKPSAWLYRVCKNKTINYLKKQANHHVRSRSIYESPTHFEQQIDHLLLDHELKESKLRVMFALCHPIISERTQVMLILKIIGGFSVDQIRIVFGLEKEAVKKILSRGKRKIRDHGITLHTPFLFQLKSRLRSVQRALYIIFNEGYRASTGDSVINKSFCKEAIFLTDMLIREGGTDPSNNALMALMLFNIARFDARIAETGEIIDLEHQNRQLWDQEVIGWAIEQLRMARKGRVLTSYHLEAGISSLHCLASSFQETQWCLIVAYYNTLQRLNPSAFVQLNRCIALSYCASPEAAIAEMNRLDLEHLLKGYYLFYVTMGKLLIRMGEPERAEEYLQQGVLLSNLEQEKNYIQKLIETMKDHS